MPRRYELVIARDGVRLATDVYLPSEPGACPAILQRTPYGKLGERPVRYAEWCVAHGYAGVVQDVRGRHDSEGTWTPYDNQEDSDGHDTIEWITRQSWSDGRVAAVGASYGAFAAFMAGLSGHPGLRAIVARVPASGLYHRHFYYGGVFSLARLAWGTSVNRRILQEANESGMLRAVFDVLIAERPEVLLHLPVAEIGDIFPMPLPWWRTWLRHATEDDYWRRLEVLHRFADLRIPVYHVGGWHDDFVTVPLANFNAARRANPAAPPDFHRLLMGMWPHALNERREHGGLDYGPEAVIPLWERELAWLDRWVRDAVPTGPPEPPVRLFLMGANVWRSYREWPPETTRPRELFLRAGGMLSFERPGPEPPATFHYDPRQPTAQPWDFGEPDLPALAPWPLDPSPGPARLLYRSAPLLTPLTVIGEVWLRFHASSSARDTDWFAWVAWKDPATGQVRLLTYGYALRARFRRSYSDPELLDPGKVERYEINLGATARVLPAGTRLLCCIQSSCVPWFSRNLNTGGDNYQDRTLQVAEQTLYHDEERPGGHRPASRGAGVDRSRRAPAAAVATPGPSSTR
jgi:putative CocE/NonD family hydrolase